MRNTKVVSISMPAEMLKAAEIMAKQENRTMSELVREALRVYQRERLAAKPPAVGGFVARHRIGFRIGFGTELDCHRIGSGGDTMMWGFGPCHD
jgi:hypothetical protein